MSTVIGSRSVSVNTDLGLFNVKTDYLTDFDIEDIISARAESQARVIQMVNVGQELDPTNTETGIPTAFSNIQEELDE